MKSSSIMRQQQPQREPWRHRHFQKEKLRVKERYWRWFQSSSRSASDAGNEPQRHIVIPDARSWRRYLPLLTKLVNEEGTSIIRVQLVLLESAVELLDWRNLNPCVPQAQDTSMTKEATAPRERSQFLHLLEQSSSLSAREKRVRPFCDLSVREPDCDEFDLLDFESMTVEDRNHHALARAGRMIHAASGQQILLIVDDDDNRLDLQRQNDENELLILEMTKFLRHTIEPGENLEELLQLKQKCDEDYRKRNQVAAASDVDDSDSGVHEYYSEEQVAQGLKNHDFVKGRLEVTKQNPKEAFVSVGEHKYFVNQQLGHFNRALQGDKVILKLLPESQWGRPVGRRRLVFAKDSDDNTEDNSDDDGDTPPVPSGRVVAIAEPRKRAQYIATLVDTPRADEGAVLVVPMDIRIPKIRIVTKAWSKYLQQRLLVEVDHWEVGSTYPHGRCVEILGPIGDLEVEIKCLLIENQILLVPFSAAATACLPPEGDRWQIPPTEIAKRRDLRTSRRVFSVDPPGCQDIDDTMHAEALPNGDIEVGVHIADVTYFVPHNSSLDLEAQQRGTTFYLVDRRFDMLPSLLSSDLCSLHGNVDRLAVSVMWTLSPDLETVKSVWYGRTVIHNCQAMTYDQAHNILHDKPPDEPGKPRPPPLTAGYLVDLARIPQLKKDLTILRNLGRKLKQHREDVGGAVDLSSGDLGGELKFTLDENGNPVAVKQKQELEIHNTIAEMMIMANGYVASKIYDTFPESALLRIHRTADQSRFGTLKDVLDVGGVSLEGSSNMALANTLKKVEKAGAVVNSLIKSLATRAMSEAQYVCTGQQKDGLDLSHYGLGVDRYTHFTSPIRRYADVIVHKQLLAALEDVATTVKAAKKTFDGPDRPALPSVPDSNVISIMAGEGVDDQQDKNELDEFDGDDFLDSLIDGASELALGGVDASDETEKIDATHPEVDQAFEAGTTGDDETMNDELSGDVVPYRGSEVAKIAESLNTQNRMAKLSSMECQNLFLSLYFRDHQEVTQAIVTDLRVNGFFVYIPKFDISGPVYLRDINGDIQIDPSFVGLPPTAGLEPTLAFASSEACRRFPSGKCTLIDAVDGSKGGARLEVSVPEGKQVFAVQTVDVVTVLLRSDDWDVRSRVPPPRFLLTSKGSRPPPGFGQTPTSKKITSRVLEDEAKERLANTGPKLTGAPSKDTPPSIFDALQRIDIRPVLADVPLRSVTMKQLKVTEDRQEDFKGRIVYRNFVNPDTKSATQQVAMNDAAQAAAQRRANAVETRERRNEFDSARTIEKSVMARTQRLAAEKRNARRGKAK